ncbi:MAG: hypothetical protein ACR2JY_18975, partial [Chloroflexota bacterium]
LIHEEELTAAFVAEAGADNDFADNWDVAVRGSEQYRYAFFQEQDARGLFVAVSESEQWSAAMATSSLVGPEIEDGARLLAELDRRGFFVTAAFWVHARGALGRRLIIASPLVDAEGSLPAYQGIGAAVRGLPGLRMSRTDIMAVGESDPVVQELRRTLPPDFVPDDFMLHLTGYVSYAPYLEEGADAVEIYVHRLTPGGRRSNGRIAGGVAAFYGG